MSAVPQSHGFTGLLLRDSGRLILTQVWLLLLALATTPYIVRTLGAEGYGLLSLVVAISGYLTFLDLGLGWTLTKFVADASASQDREAIRRLVRHTLAVVLATGGAGALALGLLAPVLVGTVFALHHHLAEAGVRALWVLALSFPVAAAAGVCEAALRGLRQFSRLALVQTGVGTTVTLGTVGLLVAGSGVVAVCILYAAAAALRLVVYGWMLRRAAPAVSLRPAFSVEAWGPTMRFGVFIFMNRLSLNALFHLDKVLVGLFLPLSAVAYYAVPFSLAQKLTMIAANVVTVAYPVISRQMTLGDHEGVTATYRQVSRIVFLLTATPALVLTVLADPILRYWIGPDFAGPGRLPLVLLAVGFCANAVSSLENISIEVSGRPNVTAAFLGLAGLLMLLLGPVLTAILGIRGTAAALCLSLMACAVGTVVYLNRQVIHGSLAMVVREHYLRASLLLSVGAVVLSYPARWIHDLPSLVVVASASLLTLYALGFLWVCTPAERAAMRTAVTG